MPKLYNDNEQKIFNTGKNEGLILGLSIAWLALVGFGLLVLIVNWCTRN